MTRRYARVEVNINGSLRPPPSLSLRRPVRWRLAVTDTTLRDGQQGWRPLSVEEGLEVYRIIAEIDRSGVIESVEVFPYTSRDRRLAQLLLDEPWGPRVIGWVRASIGDLRLVRDLGLDETVILASSSDCHIYYKLNTNRSRALDKYLEVVKEAYRLGLSVRLALEDVTRADIRGFVRELVKRAMRLQEREGLGLRIKLSDTLGLGLPFPEAPLPRGVPALVRFMRSLGLEPEQLEFHGHNDYGLVVANHLAAWLNGASFSNCTLFGVGERAGNCPLEVMLLHYIALTGKMSDVDLTLLPRAYKLFRDLGYDPSRYKPLVGDNAHSTMAGIHVDGLLKNPWIYLPYDPRIVGSIPSIILTPLGGRSAVAAWIANRLGYVNYLELKRDPRVEAVYLDIVRLYDENSMRSPLDEDLLVEIASRYFPELKVTVNG
ncbi:MAG: 2-isopropylmalate synthase [Desulfurococcales archaeon]|nr:2-isopropylmalate synthase [Desulfurococcales archaeon]